MQEANNVGDITDKSKGGRGLKNLFVNIFYHFLIALILIIYPYGTYKMNFKLLIIIWNLEK